MNPRINDRITPFQASLLARLQNDPSAYLSRFRTVGTTILVSGGCRVCTVNHLTLAKLLRLGLIEEAEGDQYFENFILKEIPFAFLPPPEEPSPGRSFSIGSCIAKARRFLHRKVASPGPGEPVPRKPYNPLADERLSPFQASLLAQLQNDPRACISRIRCNGATALISRGLRLHTVNCLTLARLLHLGLIVESGSDPYREVFILKE